MAAERASQATCRQQISWRCHCTSPLDASEYYHTVHGVKEREKKRFLQGCFCLCGTFVEPLCLSVCWLPVFVGQRQRCFVVHLFVSPCLLARFAPAALFARDVCCLPAVPQVRETAARSRPPFGVCKTACHTLSMSLDPDHNVCVNDCTYYGHRHVYLILII